MLTITVPETELFDEEKQEFITLDSVILELEHSLVSLSKWESKFEKPFLGKDEKTKEDILEYIKVMILTTNVPDNITLRFTQQNFEDINSYIDSAQSATTFGEMPKTRGSGEIITSELIYYWMVAFTIPFECETWHLNRLFSLIRICNLKNAKPKKMSKTAVAQKYRDLNAQRRAELGSKG